MVRQHFTETVGIIMDYVFTLAGVADSGLSGV